MSSDKDIFADEPPMWVKFAVCAAVIGVMTAVRLGAFSHRVMPIAFGMPLIVFVWLRDRKLLWTTAAIFALVTVIKYTFFLPIQDERGTPIGPFDRVVDAGLVLFDLFVITTVLHILIGRTKALRQRHAELAATNAELSAREEEIQRQNEELQSTAEELERQSEELRVVNDDLAQRERMTETLLELSRSLHVGMDNDATLSRICETLGQLIDGPAVATAILIHGPDGLKVRCHYGFGPAGLNSDVVPLERSFAALVIEQGKTGYLEDLALRPDLELPQPKVGEPMVSVLATPLLVRGKAIGTVELYSRQRRHWSEEQTALIESLAAQTSISLENAQLFEEVDRNRRRLATIIEQVPVGIAIATTDLGDVRLNAAGAAMVGEAPDTNIAAFVQRPPWQLFQDGKLMTRENFPIVRAVHGERVYPHELEAVMHTGRRLTLLVSATPFYDAEGKIVGAVSTFVDITQLKQLQRELETRRREAEEASVRKTRFLAAASHDIRTPANAISLLAELLKRTADNPSLAGDIPQLAEELRASATSLVNLVSNILDVTRFDTDKLDLHETEFSLPQLLEEEIRQVLPLAQAKRLALDNDRAPRNLWIRADRIKLGRVIGNLLGNAIKFTDSGAIKVHSRCDGDGTIQISVTDTGIGISEGNQGHIFDEFWQLSDPQRSKGSGLGLAISKRLVEAMGGSVNVRSRIGEGSIFTVALPKSIIVPRPRSDGLQT